MHKERAGCYGSPPFVNLTPMTLAIVAPSML